MLRFAFLGLAMLLGGCISDSTTVGLGPSAQPGPQNATTADDGQLWLVPTPVPGLVARAAFFTPSGGGPFPLVVVAHGSEQDAAVRATAAQPSFPILTQWLTSHGYAVLIPERPGHGKTGGPYLEDQGSCAAADYVAAGNGAADSIAAALAYASSLPHVRADDIVLIGNSAGAWGDLALAGRNPPGVKAIVAFAAGRGGHNNDRPLSNCAPDRLVAAAGVFGKSERLPTLWLYASNDTYFPPDLAQRMADAFRASGGNVEFHELPPVGSEGHGLISAVGSPPPWAPYVNTFLKAHR
ncbi:MAG TPA: dienelactone hydrolase family protein [Bauldia sp.]|nr:dienelactone hydrolase family protein [Bauldia sp.]